MVKIGLVVVDFSLGRGGERVTIGLANALCARYEVHIISLYQLNREPFFALDGQVKVHVISDRRTSGFLQRKSLEKKGLEAHFAAHTYSLLVGVASYPGILLGALRRSVHPSTKLVAWEHANYHALNRPWQLIRSFFYRKLDAIVCLTSEDALAYRLPRLQPVVIPNALSISVPMKSALDKKRIIGVGALEHEKGFDLLVDAFGQIGPQCADWQLDIFGGGSKRSELEQQIAALSLSARVTLHRPVKNISEELVNSSIFVMPSRREGFGMALIEAMECGLACVSFNCPTGPAAIISHLENGILVENGNTRKMGETLLNLMNDHGKMSQLAAGGIRSVKRFSTAENTAKWINLINTLLEK